MIHSSQALCISVFGAIAQSARRAALMRDILDVAEIRLQVEGDPTLECEVRGRRELLNEYGGGNPTCPDVVVTWPVAALTVESKFTEPLGPCGQIELVRRDGQPEVRPAACSGDHRVGSDLRTGTKAACRLTVSVNEGQRGYRSARRYWEVGAHCFRPEVLAPPLSPCPFVDGKYQLMRNLCFAAALSEAQRDAEFGFLLVYVGRARSAAETAAEFDAFKAMLLPQVAPRVGSITYEQVATILHQQREGELAQWIRERLRAGIAANPGSSSG